MAKKYVDDKAAGRIAAKTKELVGKKQDSLMHFTLTLAPDDWKVNGNGVCTKYVTADEAGFSGNVVAHVSPLDPRDNQVSVVQRGYKFNSLTWDSDNSRYAFAAQCLVVKGTLPTSSQSFEVWGYASDDGKCHMTYDTLALPIDKMGSIIADFPYPLLHSDAYNALAKKLDVAGGTMTGDLTVPNLAVADGGTLSVNALRGQGGASDYWHAIDIGGYGHDGMQFYEYNGTYDFYQSTEAGTQHTATKVGSITPDGWVGDAKLTGAPTAPTPDAGDSSTRVATTAFVGSAMSSASSLPAASASDSGKFLTVNSSGKAEWTAVPSAEGVGF